MWKVHGQTVSAPVIPTRVASLALSMYARNDVPTGDSAIDRPAVQPQVMERREAVYVVSEIRRRTPTIIELWLHPRAEPLDYRPGQYVLMEDCDQRIAQRSYSIANAPRGDGGISLLVTLVDAGQASNWIRHELREQDEVLLTGPYGTFVANPDSDEPCLYLAGGSGLAPMRALIEAELQSGRPRALTLLFSARTEADVFDSARFARWQTDHSNFSFIRTLTRGPGSGPRGRIPIILRGVCKDLTDHELFIAGSPGLVQDCQAAAEALGAARERIHTEPFFAEPVPWTEPPPAPAVEG